MERQRRQVLVSRLLSRKSLFWAMLAFAAVFFVTFTLRYFVIDAAYSSTFESQEFSVLNDQHWWIKSDFVEVDDIPAPWNRLIVDRTGKAYSYSFLGEKYILVYDNDTSAVITRLPVYE